MMETLEHTFKGVGDINEGVDSLIRGIESLKGQKGLARTIYRDMNPKVKNAQNEWKKTLRKITKQFGNLGID